MRFANLDNRLILVRDDGAIDVESASSGRFGASPAAAFAEWPQLVAWAEAYDGDSESIPIDESRLGPPSPSPAQIFVVGFNYADHIAEAGSAQADVPTIFPKLLPALTGPYTEVAITSATVDWEVELVVVIGRAARHVPASEAWQYVAGVTGGQDFSDRELQMRPSAYPQFSLGKSLPGYGPIGPVLATPDEFPDRTDIGLRCWVNGEQVQDSRTSLMIHPVADLVAYLSTVTTLHPGDVLFTGTPAGVGMASDPPRYLRVGDLVESQLEGIGRMSHRMVAEDLSATSTSLGVSAA